MEYNRIRFGPLQKRKKQEEYSDSLEEMKESRTEDAKIIVACSAEILEALTLLTIDHKISLNLKRSIVTSDLNSSSRIRSGLIHI